MSKTILFFLLLAFATFGLAREPEQVKPLHYDLTHMSGTMVFALVNRMVTEPARFQGKHIRMSGVFSSYYDDQIDRRFFGCVIADALACCSQGLAFELAKPRKFPDEYPAEGDAIIVEGDFDYEKDEGGGGFPIIRNAVLHNE